MDSLLPSNEYTEFEDRAYINPNLTVDETSSFIDNYRNTQNQNTQQINTQTQRLGTDVPTNIGGLTGAGSYFTSRYQKPQTASVIANLKATAQAKALNDVLANEQAMWKKRYQDAYNAYQKRSWNKQNPTTGGGGEGELEADTNEGDGSTKLSQYTGGEYEKGHMYGREDSKLVQDYYDTSGQWWSVSPANFQDETFGPTSNPVLYKQENENVVNVNGRDYIYLDNQPNKPAQWYRVTRSAGPWTYDAYSGEQ